MQTLKVLCAALLFSATCGSNIFTDLSVNTEELLKQSSLQELMEFQDVEQRTMMLQNITQGNCDCGPRGKGCEYVEGRRKCICDNGYADDKGVCQRCTCEVSGQICFFGWWDRYCSCPDGYSVKSKRCERCVCGPNSNLCYFSSYSAEKRCGCENGYQQRFGGCEICDCGSNSTDCSFNEKGDKQCRCDKGYSVMGGKCKECSCGDHGKCTFNGIIKSCTCDKGYAVKNGKCEACDCGDNGDCSFDENGKKICQCSRSFEEYNGICVFCSCNYGTCVPQQNGFQCICEKGYLNIDGKCVECDCKSGDCSIIDGKKICACYHGNAMKGGYCESCRCGGETDCIFEEWGNEVQKKCLCPTGYMQDKDGWCSRVPHCKAENTCPNSTVCVNTNEGYKCVCNEGFRPLRKNADPKDFGCEDICGQNNCLAGECEITGDHYHCRCQDGYAGTYCDVELDVYPKKKSLVAAFSVLATIIIVLLVTTVFFARKIQVA